MGMHKQTKPIDAVTKQLGDSGLKGAEVLCDSLGHWYVYAEDHVFEMGYDGENTSIYELPVGTPAHDKAMLYKTMRALIGKAGEV